jgi:hypothetical protein
LFGQGLRLVTSMLGDGLRFLLSMSKCFGHCCIGKLSVGGLM